MNNPIIQHSTTWQAWCVLNSFGNYNCWSMNRTLLWLRLLKQTVLIWTWRILFCSWPFINNKQLYWHQQFLHKWSLTHYVRIARYTNISAIHDSCSPANTSTTATTLWCNISNVNVAKCDNYSIYLNKVGLAHFSNLKFCCIRKI